MDLMRKQSCQTQLPTWYFGKGTLLWCNPKGLSKLHSGVPDFFPAAIHQLVGGNVVPDCLAFLPPTMMATVPISSKHRASPNTVYICSTQYCMHVQAQYALQVSKMWHDMHLRISIFSSCLKVSEAYSLPAAGREPRAKAPGLNRSLGMTLRNLPPIICIKLKDALVDLRLRTQLGDLVLLVLQHTKQLVQVDLV